MGDFIDPSARFFFKNSSITRQKLAFQFNAKIFPVKKYFDRNLHENANFGGKGA
jgi:hypothetical protein